MGLRKRLFFVLYFTSSAISTLEGIVTVQSLS